MSAPRETAEVPPTVERFHPEAYRDAGWVRGLAERIQEHARLLGRPVKLMHICGTHEHEIGRYGLRDLLPESVEVLAGPGCPVCVCDSGWIDLAIRLATDEGAIVASFGDMLAVPGSIPLRGETRGGARGDVRMSLLDARAHGGEVRAVTSVFEAARLAREHPNRQVVFFSVGFETTVIATAALLRRGVPPNFSLIEANYFTPPATHMLPTLPGFDVDGFLLPGHASAVTGLEVYRHLPEQGLACAVAGFEPVDVLAAVLELLDQLGRARPRLANLYRRVVPDEGNVRALAELDDVFELTTMRWRGIADIPASGYRLRAAYRHLSALERFPATATAARQDASEHPAGCRCADVTLGLVRPDACPLFGRRCTPDSPYGPCMVSHEGTCRAWHLYGTARGRLEVEAAGGGAQHGSL
ncbi:MAG: hydrogenase formation protein HypD [Deinococcales bacterium]